MKIRILISLAAAALIVGLPSMARASTTASEDQSNVLAVTMTMSPVDANGNMHTVVRLTYQNLTDQPLQVNSDLLGDIDPASAAPPSANHGLSMPIVLSSSPNVKIDKADAVPNWDSVIAADATVEFSITIQAIGQHRYCLRLEADKLLPGHVLMYNDAWTCAPIVDHKPDGRSALKSGYPEAKVLSSRIIYGTLNKYLFPPPGEKVDRLQLRLFNPGPGNYLTVTIRTTRKRMPNDGFAGSEPTLDWDQPGKGVWRQYVVIPPMHAMTVNLYVWPETDSVCLKHGHAWQCFKK